MLTVFIITPCRLLMVIHFACDCRHCGKNRSSETQKILESDLQSRKLHRTAGVAADSVESPETNIDARHGEHGMKLPPTTVFRSRSKHFAGTKQKEAAYFRRVATIGIQVAEALDHAYQQGVLHRDIKPGI